MNFKKIIAMTCSLALCAAVLTACGSSDSAEETTTTAETTISESAPDAETSTDDVEEEPAVSEDGEASDDTSDDTASDDTVEPEEDDAPIEDGEVSLNVLQPLADAAMAAGEWPAMMEVTDEMMLTDYFGLDSANANYKNLLVLQCPMSATMTEIIIIEAEDVEAAKADLEARQAKAKEQAWYPNDVELAEASIVGTEGNYAYFILASAAAEAEPALVDAIKAL